MGTLETLGKVLTMTVMGKHTITEARDLMATVEFRIKATDKLISDGGPVGNSDSALAAVQRWQTWKANWRKVADDVATNLTIQSVAAPLVPADVLANEPEYRRLQCAINKSCDDTHADPGDMFNVIQGIEQMRGKQIDESNHPEPTAGDPDLAALQKLDATIKAGEAAAAAAKAQAKIGIGAIPWWAWALGGSAVVAGGVIVFQVEVAPFLPRRK